MEDSNIVLKEIKCKSLLNKSWLADYCINPYIGCQHQCVYCYADYYTKKYTSHKEKWGTFIDIKINALEILRKEIKKKKRGTVFISSLTDAYQPIERKYELTRKILNELLKYQFPINIQTKSSLVLRDIDLLSKFKNCEIGFTITTLNEENRKIFEPYSSSIEEKINALQILSERKIKTYVFFGPMLPYISDIDLENYFKTISKLGIEYIYIDKLNLKPGLWDNLEKILEINYSELIDKWKEIFFLKNNYYEEIRKKIIKLCEEKDIKYIFCY